MVAEGRGTQDLGTHSVPGAPGEEGRNDYTENTKGTEVAEKRKSAEGFIAQKTCDGKPYLDYAARRARLRRGRENRDAPLGMTVLEIAERTERLTSD
jgi:hypothetical protein